jgi:hypothetical protein
MCRRRLPLNLIYIEIATSFGIPTPLLTVAVVMWVMAGCAFNQTVQKFHKGWGFFLPREIILVFSDLTSDRELLPRHGIC